MSKTNGRLQRSPIARQEKDTKRTMNNDHGEVGTAKDHASAANDDMAGCSNT